MKQQKHPLIQQFKSDDVARKSRANQTRISSSWTSVISYHCQHSHSLSTRWWCNWITKQKTGQFIYCRTCFTWVSIGHPPPLATSADRCQFNQWIDKRSGPHNFSGSKLQLPFRINPFICTQWWMASRTNKSGGIRSPWWWSGLLPFGLEIIN